MNKLFLLLLLFVIPFQTVYAQDILFSVEQSEYFFKIGEDAIIPVDINNSYEKQISGMLQYTVTQQINQGNVQFSNSNSNANSFSIDNGNQTISLNLGTSDTPSTLILNLSFNYNEGGDRVVPLGPLTIHFVSDESQKNNQSNHLQSSSQQGAQSKQSDPFSQQKQQMQQRLDQLLKNQQTLPQDPQQRLQNNQLSQDSSALKKEIQNQLQDQEQLQKEFEKELSSNSNFMNQHNQLLQNGYNVTGGNIDPISNKTGNFEVKYQNSEGKWAKIQGQMNNGTLTKLQKQTQEQQEKLLEKLKQNSKFKEFHEELTREGFTQNNIEFLNNENKTNIILQYKNQEQDNASITAIFENNEVQSVTLEKNNSSFFDMFFLIIFVIAIIVIGIIAYFIFKKFSKKKTVIPKETSRTYISIPFDHIAESQKLMTRAKQHYDMEEFKDAFASAGQALRLFLSYDIGLKKEMTNEELIRYLRNCDYPTDKIEQCLKISSLVEFAKSKATDEDFRRIVLLFEDLLKSKQ